MKTLIVQKRLAYPPGSLGSQAGHFIGAVRLLIREAREQHQSADLELADIGFIPAEDYIEVKLYFRQPEKQSIGGGDY